MNNCNCNCCDNDEIKITFEEVEDENPIHIDFNDRLNVIITHKHNELDNLDYEDAGHTGFTPSRLNLLANVGNSVTNDRLVVMANVDNVASKITARQLQDRIIRTASEIPNDLQEGQYLFLEKNENQEVEEIENNGN